MKRILIFFIILLCIVVSVFLNHGNQEVANQISEESQVDNKTQSEDADVVYALQYLPEANGWNAVPAYLDEYSTLVMKTDETIEEAVSDSTMYLGTIIGYQNEDKTISTYQVEIVDPALVLTNDDFEFDYSGNSKMIEQAGYIYLDKIKIVAVAPVYSD